ncbi:hypothetical protein DFP73DRAFT_552750 [Morchella snyderi]|nr:hypothetical protein DFP73DRAFT_552750 [Morchella snyderi]
MSELRPCTYARFIRSEIFTLYAGQSQKPFHVHKQLLAEMSPELRSHIFNDMKEGHESCMRMEHVSPQTMCQFLEFCYTGAYSEFTDELVDEDGTGEQKEELEVLGVKEELDVVGTEVNGTGGGGEVDLSFKSKNHRVLRRHKPKSELEPETEVRVQALIPHAKLYVLGDMYNILYLKSRAYGKINEIIENLGYRGCHREWIANVYVDLMRYACDNLPERAEGKTDPLVEYLASCAAWGLGLFRENKRFLEMLSVGVREDFSRIFLGQMQLMDGTEAPWEVYWKREPYFGHE